jgi:hypothetical protein
MFLSGRLQRGNERLKTVEMITGYFVTRGFILYPDSRTVWNFFHVSFDGNHMVTYQVPNSTSVGDTHISMSTRPTAS